MISKKKPQLFLLLILFYIDRLIAASPVVYLSLGKVEGMIQKSFRGNQFFAFEGVPYATPPTGKNKFKEAVPPKAWSGTLKANTIYTCIQCNQYLLLNESSDCIIGDEDCLYLNIYTPSLVNGSNLPVIVYIHGGAFMFNNGGDQQPSYLLTRHVVYVSLNYRLGPFGFLSTEDAHLPGNVGIRDQVLALRWIRSHIGAFGGDRGRVTLVGMSAGGASVHVHQLSPKSRGLFHRAVSQSGVALNPWAMMEGALKKCQKLGRLVGCKGNGNRELVECLSSRSGRQIAESVKAFFGWRYNPFSPFGVVVDAWADDPVLGEHPWKLVRNGRASHVPWIISHTSSEGLYPGGLFYKQEILDDLNRNWLRIFPFILDYNNTVSAEKLQDVSEAIKIRYFGSIDQKIDKNNFGTLIQMMSDRLFINGIRDLARMSQKIGGEPIYLYYFTYRGAHSKSEVFTNKNINFGASHCDDTAYLFKFAMIDTASTKEDRNVIDMFVDYFVDFAQNGKAPWPALNKSPNSDLLFLRIDAANNLSVNYIKDNDVVDFWDQLPINENAKLFPQLKDEL